ncbi:MAG: ATP-binding protein [Proteobacteria bacterium]|nr:ATP-binding protein [Pseudomonadota bacterium]NBS07150.1 ATP-binding protein [Verrucomicrobiota bacterium]NBS49617.1 ATP-binding protein [Verrucomicrobiota bacterium]NBS79286.1 ATP-binding protein [bacterium]
MSRDIVISQKAEWDLLTSRPYIPRSSARYPSSGNLVRVIIGPRRAGKSSYAVHLAKSESDRCGYLNFDDERLTGAVDTEALLAAMDAVYDQPEVLLLDEIQNLPNWELWANRLQRGGRRLVITGSNAHLLGSELATHLTGRHLTIPLLPFSFPEFLAATQPSGKSTAGLSMENCRSYAETGGFPEVVLGEVAGSTYLRTLAAAMIHKDIVLRHRLRAPQALDALAMCLLSTPGGPFSFRKLRAATSCRSVHTLKKYTGYLEQAFLVFTVPRFSFKPREQTAAPRKYYAIDNGLVLAAGFQSSPNHGRLLENLVAVALHRRQLRGEIRVFSWQDPQRAEVDFVVFKDRAVATLIQVCADARGGDVRNREIRGLLKASRELGCPDLLLLTGSEEGEAVESWHGFSASVRRQPLWRWLMENE